MTSIVSGRDPILVEACADRLPGTVVRSVDLADADAMGCDVVVSVAPLPPWLGGVGHEEWSTDLRRSLPAVIEAMRAGGGGRIVVVTHAGDAGTGEVIDDAVHAMWGATGLIRRIARDAGAEGVAANVVRAGLMDHPLVDRAMQIDPEVAATVEAVVRSLPIRRLVSVGEVVASVAFLASPAASFVTGVTVPVDCGLTIGRGV